MFNPVHRLGPGPPFPPNMPFPQNPFQMQQLFAMMQMGMQGNFPPQSFVPQNPHQVAIPAFSLFMFTGKKYIMFLSQFALCSWKVKLFTRHTFPPAVFSEWSVYS